MTFTAIVESKKHATKDSASPNKMAAKDSVSVPWPHILEVSASPKGLVSEIVIQNLFIFWQLPCLGRGGGTDLK